MEVRDLKLQGFAAVLALLVSSVAYGSNRDNAGRSRELARENQQYFETDSPHPPPTEDFWEHLYKQKYLTGDWWGGRTWLADHGITIDASFTWNPATNPVSGLAWSFNQANNTGAALGVDFEKLAGIPGLFFYGSFSFRQGQNLALEQFPAPATSEGGPFPIKFQQVYFGQTWHLVDLYLQQTLSLFDERDLSIRIGRLAQFDTFATDIAWSFYENNAFDGNPFGFFEQGPGAFYVYPFATWGAVVSLGAKTSENDGVFTRVGVFGADTSLITNTSNGTRFSFDFNRGYNVIMEGGYKRNWLIGNTGMPAKYVLGGWVVTGDFPKWGGGVQPGIGGVYYVLSQGLYLESDQTPL